MIALKPQTPLIKMCGFRQAVDVRFAQSLGVDYYGLVFYEPSLRYISPSDAAPLVQLLSKQAHQTPVGLFVNHSPDQVVQAVQISGVRVLQFHGTESAAFCENLSQKLGLPYWKAVHVTGDAHSDDLLKSCLPFSSAQALLFDTASPAWGGTGHTFEWQKLAPLATLKNVPPLVLSGGLNAQNVAKGITLLNPWAVDVSSGIEAIDAFGAPLKGFKDSSKMAAFVAACATPVHSN